MRYDVCHATHYHYAEPVSLCHNLLHLEPRPHPRQRCTASSIVVDPAPEAFHRQLDAFGNPMHYFSIQQPHRRLSLVARCALEVRPPAPLTPSQSPAWETVRDRLATEHGPDLLEAVGFRFDSHYVPTGDDLARFALPAFAPGRPLLEAAFDLTERIYRDFRYDPDATTISTPIRAVLANRHGVCQDFAHLALGCLRSLGLAARYVSGYLLTRPPPGQPRLAGVDASHAWFAVFCPPFGWIDFDPTNGLIPTDQHLTLAWGRDYDDISPVRGIILGGGGRGRLTVAVDVLPADERSPVPG